jgi:putative ABC transport system permease protein
LLQIEREPMSALVQRARRLGRRAGAVGVIGDVIFATRTLRASPGYAAAAIGTLAIGIGATTAIFSVVDGVLLKPLPFSRPAEVVALYQNDHKKSVEHDDVAPANFADWRSRSQAFSGMAAAEPFALTYATAEGVEQVYNWNVTADFFRVLDTRPALGRLFVPADFTPGPARVLILTYASWHRRFGSDPSIIGRRLQIGRGSATVVGVLSPNFDYLSASKMEMYAPKVLDSIEVRIRNTAWYHVIGRLEPGVSLAAARADAARIGTQLTAEYPGTNATVGVTVERLDQAIVGDSRRAITLLFAAVFVVLLIACVNVANLVLARTARRRRELVVRAALGATRWRIVRQLMTEHFLIVLAGGAAGVISAGLAVRAIRSASPAAVPRLADVGIDGRALLFTLGIVGVTTMIVGLVPALRATTADPASELRAGTRASSDATRGRVRRLLVIAEVALAFVLLVGAGLLMRSFLFVIRADRGYKSDHVLAATVFVYQWNRTPRARFDFIDALVKRAATVPGVRAAGATSSLPLDIAIGADQGTFTIAGRSVSIGQEPSVHMTAMTTDAFTALGIPLRRGRLFSTADDSASAPVVVVNEAMARRYWPGVDPIGQRLRLAFYSTPMEREVVGVVADTRQRTLDDPAEPILYVPHAQAPTGAMAIVLRTANEPRTVLRDFRRAVAELNPALPLSAVETLDDLAAASVRPREFILTLLGAFAACALLLAVVGIYAVINQGVLERRSELGVRLALGALPARVIGMIVRQGITLAAVGVALGGIGAFVVTALLRGMLVGVRPIDVPTFIVVALVMVATAALASAVPARRASRLDPVESLRAN